MDRDPKKARRIFMEVLRNQMLSDREHVKKLIKELRVDAVHALSWGESEFRAAARKDVIFDVLNSLRKGTSLDYIMEYAVDQLVTKTESMSNSAMQSINMMTRHEVGAWAYIVRTLKSCLKGHE